MRKTLKRSLGKAAKTVKVVGQGCLDDCNVPYLYLAPKYQYGRIVGYHLAVGTKKTAFVTSWF